MSADLQKEEASANNNQESQTFGSFFLGNVEFALSVTHVQEVVNSPSAYTSLPLAPNYLVGLLNLRGSIIPVVDLRALLNLSVESTSDSKKVAILEMDGCCVGLLFDRTGEIFRSNDEERSDFNDDSSTHVISGVFKKEAGARIVQILDVSKLFKLQNVPKDASKSRLAREHLNRKRGQRKQCISFVVGRAKCALAISDIQEILKVPKLSDSALGAGNCIGTIDLRGTTIPVIDFSALLKYREIDRSSEATQGERRIIVMKVAQELFGLMVESVDSIISYFSDELISFPIIEQSRGEMFVGCITGHNNTDILLLDHTKILTQAEAAAITHGHSSLFQDNAAAQHEKKSKGGARSTYITFSIDGSYAIGINEVKEIIDYPKALLQPPGLPKLVIGVLNLRGELVTIVDARTMYQTGTSECASSKGKVLIFKRGEIHFGLVVDAVESIVSFSENDKIKLPEILYNANSNGMTADISEAVEIQDSNGQKRNLLILSADAIAQRARKSIAA